LKGHHTDPPGLETKVHVGEAEEGSDA
jgi:hypothetical protein